MSDGPKRIPTVKWKTRWGWHESRTRGERDKTNTAHLEALGTESVDLRPLVGRDREPAGDMGT